MKSQLILSIGFFIVFSLKETLEAKPTSNALPKFTRSKKSTFEKVLLIKLGLVRSVNRSSCKINNGTWPEQDNIRYQSSYSYFSLRLTWRRSSTLVLG
jgi:hypothetical protein